MTNNRLQRQIEFLLEIDKLKTISRRTYICGGLRHENSAEHSWHLALMALVLSECSNEQIDVSRVVKLLLVHDLIEVYAGDTFCYDTAAMQNKDEREDAAAKKLFGMLPDEQAQQFLELWQEFERGETAESKFANAVDRLMPLLHNAESHGKLWREHGVKAEQVLARTQPIEEGAKELWVYAQAVIRRAVEKGQLVE